MCLIFISFHDHPTYKLVVAANRDEFYNRPTAPAEFWKDHPRVLGGRDLEAQGTWMGMTIAGKISMLTNYRDPANINPHAPSRGHLVSDFLEQDVSAGAYAEQVSNRAALYNGFNLVVGDPDQLWYLSNYKEGADKLGPGIYGLSNHLLDTPWPKIVRGKKKFADLLRGPEVQPDRLMELLYDEERSEDALLPDTGVGLELERALSSMFIKTSNYGSRCSTVVLVDKRNHVLFSERVYDLTTFAFTTRTFEFDVDLVRTTE